MRVVLVAIFALCSASFRSFETVSETVAAIEINHFHDQIGRVIYDQVIFYEIGPEDGRFRVRAWCLVDDKEALNRRPVKNEATGVYQVDWRDTDNRVLRRVNSRILRETWTQKDPEREDKKHFHESLRLALGKKVRESNEHFQPD